MKEVQDIFLMLSSYKDGTVPAIILILVLNIISWKKYIEGKNYNF